MTLREIRAGLPQVRINDNISYLRISTSWYKKTFDDLPLETRRKYVRVSRTNVNRKLNLLSKSLTPDEFIFNPAYQALNKEGRGGVNKGVRINKMKDLDLFSEFQKNMYFLEAKTSTVKGAIDYFSKLDRIFDNSSAFQNLTRDEKREFWKIVKDLKDSGYYKKLADQLSVGSDFVVNKIYEAYSSGFNTVEKAARMLIGSTGVSLEGTKLEDLSSEITRLNNGYNSPSFINY